MGHVNTHGIFVHLYLNGLYWGLYNLAERPNQDFSASYFGGNADTDWDSISGSAMNTTPLKNGDWNGVDNVQQPGRAGLHLRRLRTNPGLESRRQPQSRLAGLLRQNGLHGLHDRQYLGRQLGLAGE